MRATSCLLLATQAAAALVPDATPAITSGRRAVLRGLASAALVSPLAALADAQIGGNTVSDKRAGVPEGMRTSETYTNLQQL